MNDIILAFFASLFPAVLLNSKAIRFIPAGLSGVAGWMTYSWLHANSENIVFSTFAGALAVGLYSEAAARITKAPASIYSVSGIFPLLPGVGAYETARLLVENKVTESTLKGIETLSCAGAIALGIMLASSIFKSSSRLVKIHKH